MAGEVTQADAVRLESINQKYGLHRNQYGNFVGILRIPRGERFFFYTAIDGISHLFKNSYSFERSADAFLKEKETIVVSAIPTGKRVNLSSTTLFEDVDF